MSGGEASPWIVTHFCYKNVDKFCAAENGYTSFWWHYWEASAWHLIKYVTHVLWVQQS